MYGCSTFLFFVIFFLNLPFTLLFFRLLKNIPGKYRTLTCLLPFFIRKGRISRFMHRCQFTVPFCTSVMVKCMEKAHSGYTNHHLLLLFSGRGVFSLGNSLHAHILIRTGSRIHSSSSSSYRVKEDQRHTRKDFWVGVPTPGGGSSLEILLAVSHEVRISVGQELLFLARLRLKY